MVVDVHMVDVLARTSETGRLEAPFKAPATAARSGVSLDPFELLAPARKGPLTRSAPLLGALGHGGGAARRRLAAPEALRGPAAERSAHEALPGALAAPGLGGVHRGGRGEGRAAAAQLEVVGGAGGDLEGWRHGVAGLVQEAGEGVGQGERPMSHGK